jgi:hypothetical protein
MSIRRWRVGLGVALFAALSMASLAWATLLTPTLVVGGAGSQRFPSATPAATFVGFSANRAGAPNLFDAYVKPSGGPREKVNTSGIAFAGGFDGDTFIYQRVVNGQSDIGLYDVMTTIHSLPTGVNTTAWEWSPTISGDWILFGRQNPNSSPISDHIVLHNELTAETRMLDQQVGAPDKLLTAGQVNGDYVSWDRLVFSTHTGTVVRYQISTESRFTVPRPTGKVQYASSVDPAGDLFYVRSGLSCGKQVVIREAVPGVSDVALATVPAGYDVVKTYAVDEGGGVISLYFDRLNCSTGQGGDIYKLTIS